MSVGRDQQKRQRKKKEKGVQVKENMKAKEDCRQRRTAEHEDDEE